MDERTPASYIHWTAKVSCGFSVCTALIFLIQLIDQRMNPPFVPLHYIVYLGIYFLQLVFSFMPQLLPFAPSIYLPLSSFIFACIALPISSRQPWRKGRGIAIVSVILPGIILTLYGALIVYLLFFWHPHFVW